MPTPGPGRPVRGSESGRPVMAALDLLGRRWVMRILWELRDGPLGFRALQAACDGMSSSVLSTRLADLVETRLVTIDDQGAYALTAIGLRLGVALQPLHDWSRDWAQVLASEQAGGPAQRGRADGPAPRGKAAQRG